MGRRRRLDQARVGPLGAENLAGSLASDFGAAGDVAQEGVRTFYAALIRGGAAEIPAAVGRWRSLAAGGLGHADGRELKAAPALAETYRIAPRGLRPGELFLAVQSYYVLLVKLLVWQVTSRWGGVPGPCDALLAASGASRRRRLMEAWESGRALPGLPTLLPCNGSARPTDPFSWYTAAWSDPIDQFLGRAAARLARYDPEALCRVPLGGGDLLGGLYQQIIPRRVRHLLGEYYTPGWLAAEMLDEVGFSGQPGRRLLDPACGSGTFLILAIQRLRRRACRGSGGSRPDAAAVGRAIASAVAGLDLNPLAVITARAGYLLALGSAGRDAAGLEIPIWLGDSILGSEPGPPSGLGRFDYVVGNPPWIAWDDLPDPYRQATKPLWRRYGLFSLSGSEARHGGGKKDLSMLMTYAVADRFLAPSGRLALVVTQTLFQTKGAGDGFRRFRLGESGPWLGVERVNDLVEVRPFAPAANWTATIVLEKDRPTVYPVPYVRWLRGDRRAGQGKVEGLRGFRRRAYGARPIDPARPGSPWFLWPEGWSGPTESLFGPSDYQAHLGANSGGANGVFWLSLADDAPGREPLPPGSVCVRNTPAKARKPLQAVRQAVEADLVYPLLRWGDVARYRAVPGAYLLLTQDVHTRRGIAEPLMRSRWPLAYAYLERFRAVLAGRSAYRRYQSDAAFYSMYDVGPYTLAPIKVVWRRMDRRINAAVVERHDDPRLGPKAVVPQETCVLIAADSPDEAHYLCAVLNGVVAGFLVGSHSVRGGKGFGTPSVLEYLRLRRFDAGQPIHTELAAAGRQAHRLAAEGRELCDVQRAIDRLAARLWDLSDDDLRQVREAVEHDGAAGG